MADSVPAYVQVLPNQGGAKIRNVQLDLMQSDGTVSTVEAQVVVLSNEDGKLWNPGDCHEALMEQMQKTNLLLELILESLNS